MVADRQTVALDLASVAVDVESFMRADVDARIVELYDGEFLVEERYEDWATPLREEAQNPLHRRRPSAASIVVRWRRNRAAATLARRLIESDPYDVTAREGLAKALEGMGDPAAAARARSELDELVDDLARKDF